MKRFDGALRSVTVVLLSCVVLFGLMANVSPAEGIDSELGAQEIQVVDEIEVEPDNEQSPLELDVPSESMDQIDVVTQADGIQQVSGSCGADATYVVEYHDKTLTNGSLVISGTGDMSDYRITDASSSDKFPMTSAPWSDTNVFQITSLRVNGISHIGDYAFCGMAGLSSVELSGSVTSMGAGSFWGCASLTEMTIPDGVTSIGTSAFYYCINLTTLYLPSTLQTIDKSAFYECAKLADVYFDGTQEEWDALVEDGINNYRNESLLNANVHLSSAGASLWESVDASGIPQSKVGLLTWSGGNFSWATSSGKDVYDNLYLRVERESTDPLQADANAVRLTLPEGFSFQSTKVVSMTEMDLINGVAVVEVFPLYVQTLAYDKLLVDVQFMTAIDGQVQTQKALEFARLKVNDDSCKVMVADVVCDEVAFDADWFEESSYTYNHNMASTQAALSAMAYLSDEQIRTSWHNLGFSDVFIYRGDEDPDNLQDTVDFSIARKRVVANDNARTVVAVAVRGTPFEADEWLSNFYVEMWWEEHYGFTKAKENVAGYLWTYLMNRDIDFNHDSSTRLMLTGHSRGAATANLLAANYDDAAQTREGGLRPKHVYCHTFATPNSTKDPNISTSLYKNIFNYTYVTDLVPAVAPHIFGFNKYGITYSLPSPYGTTGYASVYEPAVKQTYLSYTGQEYDPVRWEDYAEVALGIQKELQNDVGEQVAAKAGKLARGCGKKLFGLFGIACNISSILPKMICAHSMLGYLSWMKTTSGTADLTRNMANFKLVRVMCPVDVEVRDGSGNVAARIANDVVDESCTGVYAMDLEGVKYVFLPRDASYEVAITATDDGTMDYSVFEYGEDGACERSVSAYGVELRKDTTYTAIISGQNSVNKKAYKLAVSDGTTIMPNLEIDETPYADTEDVEALVPELIAAQATVGDEPAVDHGAVLASGENGEHVTWTFYEDGTMVFAGYGRMTDHSYWWNWDNSEGNDIPWARCKDGHPTSNEYGSTDYRGQIRHVVIEEGITYIGNYTFWSCGHVEDISLPSTLTGVGSYAFSSLGTSCKGIVVPSGLTELGEHAYSGTGLSRTVVIPKGITEIPAGAFSGCTKLTGIELHEGITSIGADAFANSGLKSFSVPDSVTSLGAGVIRDCHDLTTLTLGAGITEIPDGAFKYVLNLMEIEIREGVTSIGNYAFDGDTGLTKITLPDSLMTIGEAAFSNCSSLNTVNFGKGLKSIGLDAFRYSGLYHANLPEGLMTIGESAFEYCERLRDVVVPDSVTVLEKRAFLGCKMLESAILGDGVTVISQQLFNSCGKDSNTGFTHVALGSRVTAIEGLAFYGCVNLESIDFPETLKSIGDFAFEETGIKGIHLPDGLTTLGSSVFEYCSCLEKVMLGNSLTSVPLSAFYNCDIREIEIPSSVESIGGGAFADNQNLKRVVLHDGLLSMDWSAFANCSIEEVDLPDTLESMGTSCFKNNEQLREITIPDKVQVIEYGTFSGCRSLEKVTLGAGLRRINGGYYSSDGAFAVTGIREIIIPKGVMVLGKAAFAYPSFGTGQSNCVIFEGDAPFIDDDCFCGRTMYAFYPAGNDTWNSDVMLDYGGHITWSEIHDHVAASPVRENEVVATCTEAGSYEEATYCSICGFELARETKDVAALGHSYGDWRVSDYDAPTCTSAGEKYRTCTRCNDYDWADVPATGHAWGKWSKVDDAYHVRSCANCYEKQTAKHSWRLTKETKGTASGGGQAYYTCSGCGATKTVKLPVLNKSSATIYTTKTIQLKLNNNKAKVAWSSSNKSVATVSSSGKVTGKKKGKVTISAKANGMTYKCIVTVKASTLKLSKTKVTIKVGQTVTIKATPTPAGKVTWKTSDKSVATVTTKGVIKGVKKGKATITATANGVTKKVTVKVS